MRFEKIDLNLLVALDVLLEDANVGRAAERLNLSQPAMSNALSRIRKLVGDPLLIRCGRSLELTPRARELQLPVREILQRVRSELVQKPAFDPATSTRQFVIAASDYTIRVLLMPAFRELSLIAPKVRFQVVALTENVRDDFDKGETDLLIAPSQIISSAHPGVLIFEDDYVVAACQSNEAVANGVDADTYFKLGHVNANFGKSATAAFDEWLDGNTSQKRKIEISLPSFRDVPEMLIGTKRIATMHSRYALGFMEHLPIRIFPIPFKHPKLQQFAQWHRLRDNDNGIKWLVNVLGCTVKALPIT